MGWEVEVLEMNGGIFGMKRKRKEVKKGFKGEENGRKMMNGGGVVHLLPLLPLLPLLRWEMAGYGSWSEGEEKKRRK